MSDKPDKKAESHGAAGAAPAKDGEAKPAGGVLKSTPVLFGMVMITEAAVLFAGFKFLGSGAKPVHAELSTSDPASTEHGGDDKGGTKTDKKKLVELSVLEFKAPNKQTGRTFLYDVSLYVSTKVEHKERVEAIVKEREATIKDRVRTIIAQSDPEKLGGGVEPGLETLRRQVKFQLDELIGEGLIEEVLIPRCIPYRTEF